MYAEQEKYFDKCLKELNDAGYKWGDRAICTAPTGYKFYHAADLPFYMQVIVIHDGWHQDYLRRIREGLPVFGENGEAVQ